ncbi:MAG: carbohydrate ABC transporter permease [Eubacterium sp.]|nr:carbohydrate ABC transporter permease [Eubacterium sp.]MCI8919416.1 carbohydrate ABC transporter permease [Eubacterium sp.]
MNGAVIGKKHLPFRIFLGRAAVVLLAAAVLFPVLYMFMNAFAQETDGGFFPSRFGLSGFYEVFVRRPDYLVKFWNSILLSVAIVAGQGIISCLAGYGFAKFNFPFKEAVYYAVIVIMLMPYQVTLVSNFIVTDALDLNNTYWAILLPGIFSPFGVFLMRQGFETVPEELRGAAMLEGASQMRILMQIALPLCRWQLMTLVLLSFVDAWNMVEQPLVFLKEAFRYPISVFLAQMSESRIDILCTCGIMVTLPVLLLFLFCEEDLTDSAARLKS